MPRPMERLQPSGRAAKERRATTLHQPSKELATSQAVAPLQQQITDLTAQIKKMQEQMKADANAALQGQATAHTQGLEYGAGIGVSSTLVLFALIFGIRRLTSNFTVTKKP